MTPRLVVAALVFATGCVHGTTPETFAPAMGPEGARVAVRVRGEPADRIGELLAADSIGITIRWDRIIRVAWAQVDALAVEQGHGDFDIQYGETVSPEKRRRLALIARFPQGLRGLPITIDSMIAAARGSSIPFADRRNAVVAGYRRVGADFPGMGEHWINVEALMLDHFDPARPAILTYADIGHRPTLLGVGYALVTHGDSVPTEAPGWPEFWHEHSGLLSEESAGGSSRHHSSSASHVWVMHVWTMLPNPAGPFAADNWALPFVRAGLPIPSAIDERGGRALSLAVGGDDFLRDALTALSLRTPENAPVVDSLIAAATTRVKLNMAKGLDVDTLLATWSELVSGLERTVGTRVESVVNASHSTVTHSGVHP
jgi:hypothetical protein